MPIAYFVLNNNKNKQISPSSAHPILVWTDTVYLIELQSSKTTVYSVPNLPNLPTDAQTTCSHQ